MDLTHMHQEVTNIIANVNFFKLWEGFKPYKFAIYDNEKVCFKDGIIDKTDAFMANTAIEYKGEYIAIWNLMEEMDTEILASKLIHEMFHAFQLERNEKCFPHEMTALLEYEYNPMNLTLKLKEHMLMDQLLKSFDRNSYENFLSIRKYRYEIFPKDYEYEAKVEQIEGSANYVELEALKQINISKYDKKLSEMVSRIKDYNNFIPIRIITYDIGALFIKIVKDNKIKFDFSMTETPYFIDCLENVIKADINETVDKNIKIITEEKFNRSRFIIDKAIDKNEVILEGDYEIYTVNIYNASYVDQHIISNYFLIYLDKEEKQILYGDFVIKINSNKRLDRVYKQ